MGQKRPGKTTKASKKRTVKKRSSAVKALQVENDVAELDACEVAFVREVSTLDEDLPPAAGGVSGSSPGSDDSCACDVAFNRLSPTLDEELPAAEGGVS